MCSIACASAENRLPRLKLLDISQNNLISHRYLLSQNFSSLAYFILCSCDLDERDLQGLAQAKLDDKLPALKYIDVSFNNLSGCLVHLTRDHRTGRQVFWDKIVCFDKFLDGSKLLLSAQNNC